MTMQSAPTGMQLADDVTEEAMVALATTGMPGAILQASGPVTDGDDSSTHAVADKISGVIVETDPDAAGGVAVSPPDDPIAADDHSDAAIQPEWGVAPDDFHAGSPDDTSDDEDSQRPDILGDEADEARENETAEVDDNGVTDLGTEATTTPDVNETPPGATTEAVSDAPPAASSTEASQAGSAAADEAASEAELNVQHLSKQALDSLLDELTGELVALEDFGGEVDDRAFENEWLGSHTDLSLAVFRAQLLKTGRCTFDVDESGKLLEDPVKFPLAQKDGARITLRVYGGLSETQKRSFILLKQARERVRTEAENRELKRRIILEGLVQGLTYQSIAKMAGVHPNTVRNVQDRAAADPNSKLRNTTRPDGRLSPENREKVATARELRAEGKSNPEIAAVFGQDVETVGKWFKDPTSRAKKKHKQKPVAAIQPTEDLAANDGIPKVHRAALYRLGKNAQDYSTWLEDAFADAQKEIKAAADNVENVLTLAIYASQRLAAANSWLKSNCSVGGEVDVEESPPGNLCPDGDRYKPGTILLGTVMDVGQDEVLVALPDGGVGVIDNRDNCLAKYGPLEVGKAYRVRVEGFDPDRNLVILQPQGLQTPAPYDRSTALGSDCDEESTPDAEDAACEADAETTEVSA